MTSAEIANAYVTLQVQMPGVKKHIESIVGGVAPDAGKAFSAGLAGAVGGAVAAVTTKVIDSVMGSIDAAVTRVDTINNFPKIMQNLGYSSDDAAASVKTMSERLMGLPTSLDAMTGMVQQLAPLTGGLGEATELSLAFNNALLAGGKSTDIQRNAMEQFTQMLSVGKVDMSAWRSIVTAMPGQVNQLAEALLGAGAGQMDLYKAMQDGSVSFDQFNDAVVALNSDGVGAFASFEEQARSATDGIATSQANLNTAIVRGIAGLISKFEPQITAFLGFISGAVTAAFQAIGDGFDWLIANGDIVIPVLSGIAVALLVALAPAIWAAVTATWAFTVALLANPLTWVLIAIVALVAGIVALAMNWDTVVAWISEVWGGFISWITSVIDGFVGWWNGIWDAVSQWFTDVWNGIVSVAGLLLTTFFATFQLIGAAISSWWNGLWSGISSFFVGIWEGIVGAIQNVQGAFDIVFKTIGGIIRGAFEGVVSFVRGVINGIIDAINTVIGGINGVVGAVGGAFGLDIQIGKLPRLGDGATVLPRPGGTAAILAERGRAESVVDTGLMNRALEEGLAGNRTATVIQHITTQQTDPRIQARQWGREAERAFAS